MWCSCQSVLHASTGANIDQLCWSQCTGLGWQDAIFSICSQSSLLAMCSMCQPCSGACSVCGTQVESSAAHSTGGQGSTVRGPGPGLLAAPCWTSLACWLWHAQTAWDPIRTSPESRMQGQSIKSVICSRYPRPPALCAAPGPVFMPRAQQEGYK